MSQTPDPDPLDALTNSVRRAVLLALREHGTLSVNEISARFPEKSRPTISHHLRVLREAGLIVARRRGQERLYSVNIEAVNRIYQQIFRDQSLPS